MKFMVESPPVALQRLHVSMNYGDQGRSNTLSHGLTSLYLAGRSLNMALMLACGKHRQVAAGVECLQRDHSRSHIWPKSLQSACQRKIQMIKSVRSFNRPFRWLQCCGQDQIARFAWTQPPRPPRECLTGCLSQNGRTKHAVDLLVIMWKLMLSLWRCARQGVLRWPSAKGSGT